METQSQDAASRLDTPLLVVAVLLLVGGIFAFYYLDGRLILLGRLGVLVAAVVVGVLLAYRTAIGRRSWSTVTGSRVEMRKVVWPSRQQSVQLTLLVAVVVLLTALFMWLVDSVLLIAAKQITGGG